MPVERWGHKIPLRLRSLFHRADVEQELNEELLFHFEQLVAQETARGKTPEQARQAASRAFGNLTAVREAARETWGWTLFEQLWQDLRYAFRILRRSPGFTATAVLTLGLGIGANTAIFSLIESTLLRPITVKHPERLRLLSWREQGGGWFPWNIGYLSPTFGTIYELQQTPDGGLIHTDFTPGLYRAFLRQTALFDSVFGFKELGRVPAVVDGKAEALNCFLVSGDFYRGLEVAPIIGRAIGPNDDVKTRAGSVVLISYQYWTRRFHRSHSVIGQTITLDGLPVTIIGVNPEYFTGVEPGADFDIWAPLNLSPIVEGRIYGGALPAQSINSFVDEDQFWSIPVMGRLKPGVSDQQAQKALSAVFQWEVDAYPGPEYKLLAEPHNRPQFELQPASRGIDYLTERYQRLFYAVLALAGLVLLVACVNVANLLLAKSATRQREISLRIATGAGRWRIASQLLTEGLLLAVLAGIAGVVFAWAARNAIPALLSTPWRSSLFNTSFDPRIFMFCTAATILTGILFSLAPMWSSSHVDVSESLKEGGHGAMGRSRLRLGQLLVVLQIALSIVLLAEAGFSVRTFRNLRDKTLGFKPQDVVTFTLDPPRLSYPPERVDAILLKLQERLRTIPGVQTATFSGRQGGFGSAEIWLGSDEAPVDESVSSLLVGSHFFKTMGIPILSGRAIDERDVPGQIHAVVVNQEFVRRFFPQNPLGRRFTSPEAQTIYRIVGVCTDWRTDPFLYPNPIRPAFYRALAQEPYAGSIDFEVKAANDGTALVLSQIPDVVRTVGKDLVPLDAHTELEQIANALAPQRLMASLAEVFGGLALLLASTGIFGVMAYTTARRTNEIGIRTALGARPAGVVWMMLRETLLLLAAGVAIGLPVVLAINPLLDHFLGPYWRNGFVGGLKADDPVVIGITLLILIAAALLAGYLPARRAARIDPMAALRHD